MTTSVSEAGAGWIHGDKSRSASSQQRSTANSGSNKRNNGSSSKQPAVTTSPSVTGSATAVLPGVSSLLDLTSADKKEIAMRLVSTAENSSLDWRAQFSYIEDIGDGRGYTGGIVGFCSGTGDMLQLVQSYTATKPANPLAPYLSALKQVNGTELHTGLGDTFVAAWKLAALDPAFQQAQENLRDEVYFKPAVTMAKTDGLGALGQFAYYDAAVMHGPDAWGGGLPDIRKTALASAKTPTQGGDEKAYLQAFLTARKVEMSKESAHRDLTRITGAQEKFLNAGNLGLQLPLTWSMYGDNFSITSL